MSYDRFSSWDADKDQEKEEEVVESLENSYDEPQSEPVVDPEPVELAEADQIVEQFRSLDIGESLRIKADKKVFMNMISVMVWR
jgi:tRNA uridine 5-carbamoylmethylation protein Kti12